MNSSAHLLLRSLAHPHQLATLKTCDWEQLICLARRHGVSGRFAGLLNERAQLDSIPAEVAKQLTAESLVAEQRTLTARWEVECIKRALARIKTRIVLLKGAAYILAGIPCGNARMLSDVDILVSHADLAEVESALLAAGWASQADNTYDDAYFRRWMHELPPLQHTARGTVVDVHHNILPRISRLCPDADKLLTAAIDLHGHGVAILAPADMLLHSIVHGFHNGEFDNALRDVLDVHELVTHFAARDETFWSHFLVRTAEFRFERPAYYALTAAQEYFGTAVPASTMRTLTRSRPGRLQRQAVHWAIDRVLVPAAPPDVAVRTAARVLQIRSHLNKMPIPTLTWHLANKLWRRWRQKPAPVEEA